MSGKIVIADGRGHEIDGGDYWERGRASGDYRFTRFGLTFADGGSLLLIDPRRLGRVRLDPPVEKLGPDAQTITPAQFRAVLARGTAPVKARLLDQEAIAGIGNLLADEILWRAKVHPARPVDELSPLATGAGCSGRSGGRSGRPWPAGACTRCPCCGSAPRAHPARGAAPRWRRASSAAGPPGGARASRRCS